MMLGSLKKLALAFSIHSSLFFSSASASPEPSSLDLVERQTPNNSSAATWIYSYGSGNDGGNFTFTITVNPANNDMWFRMSAPSMYSWISVGTGSNMEKSKVMLMAYEGSKDNSVTISARGPCDHCEPAFMKSFGLNSAVTPSSDPNPYGVNNGTYSVSGFVANGTRRAGIDPSSKNQPFIFAVGPVGHAPRSDAFDAPLRMHALHGTFQLDMTKAQGIKLPLLGSTEAGVTAQGSSDVDHERASPVHAFIMCLAFVLVLPVGVLMLRLFGKVKLHMIVMGLGSFLVVIGSITGFVLSKNYNRSKNFNSPHQIIGILLLILLIVQFAFGMIHHRTYLKTQQPTFLIKPHKFALGPIIMVLGLVNAAIGFRFAVAGGWNMIYVPIVIAMLILLLVAVTLKRFIAGRKKKAQPFGGPEPPVYNAAGGQGAQQPPPVYGGPTVYGAPGTTTITTNNFGQRSDIELGKMGPPPSYDTQPARPREML